MAPEPKKENRGGARPGAGRKPKAITILKQRKLEDSEAEAEKSFDMLVQMRDDSKRPDEIRKDCAIEVMDRVWGKSKMRQELTGKDGAPLAPKTPPLDMSKLSQAALEKLAELKDA